MATGTYLEELVRTSEQDSSDRYQQQDGHVGSGQCHQSRGILQDYSLPTTGK